MTYEEVADEIFSVDTSETRWYSTSEVIPKDGQNILIYYRYKDNWDKWQYKYMQTEYIADKGFWQLEENMNKWQCKFLAWMPIPELPFTDTYDNIKGNGL